MRKGEKPSAYTHQGESREMKNGLMPAQIKGVEWLFTRLHKEA